MTPPPAFSPSLPPSLSLSPSPSASQSPRALSSKRSPFSAPPCARPRRRRRRRAAPSAHMSASEASADARHIVIAGGAGFVGTALTKRLLSCGDRVTILTRRASAVVPSAASRVLWTPDAPRREPQPWERAVRDAHAVVNLCGAPVVSRWDAAGKKRITQSRLTPTARLAACIAAQPVNERPHAFVSASAVGYYGTYDADTPLLTENAPAGSDFLGELCTQWEAAAHTPFAKEEQASHPRVVTLRTGVVLGARGGALARMVPPFAAFVGGAVGSGRQIVSWIHVDDVVRIVQRALCDESRMSGAYNVTAPNAVSMSELAAALGETMRRPAVLPVPEVALRVLYGDGCSVVTRGQRVVPDRLLRDGFHFEYAFVRDALRAVMAEW